MPACLGLISLAEMFFIYHIRRKFDLEFILAVWQITESAKLNTA